MRETVGEIMELVALCIKNKTPPVTSVALFTQLNLKETKLTVVKGWEGCEHPTQKASILYNSLLGFE